MSSVSSDPVWRKVVVAELRCENKVGVTKAFALEKTVVASMAGNVVYFIIVG